jgi:hypothetical protein
MSGLRILVPVKRVIDYAVSCIFPLAYSVLGEESELRAYGRS